MAYLGFGVTRMADRRGPGQPRRHPQAGRERGSSTTGGGSRCPACPSVVLVLAMNFVGDALRDALDPATHTRPSGPWHRAHARRRAPRSSHRSTRAPRLLADARDRLPRVSFPSLSLPALPAQRPGQRAPWPPRQSEWLHSSSSRVHSSTSSECITPRARGPRREAARSTSPLVVRRPRVPSQSIRPQARTCWPLLNDSLETKIRVYSSTDGGPGIKLESDSHARPPRREGKRAGLISSSSTRPLPKTAGHRDGGGRPAEVVPVGDPVRLVPSVTCVPAVRTGPSRGGERMHGRRRHRSSPS